MHECVHDKRGRGEEGGEEGGGNTRSAALRTSPGGRKLTRYISPGTEDADASPMFPDSAPASPNTTRQTRRPPPPRPPVTGETRRDALLSHPALESQRAQTFGGFCLLLAWTSAP